MRRLALVLPAVLMGATACGSALSVRSAVPVPNIVVYARPSHMSNRVADVSGPMIILRSGIDGSHPRQLATGTAPAVSPDGRLVAFFRDRDLLVMPAAGGAAERVYAFKGENDVLGIPAVWAPDSRHLALETLGGLAVVDVSSNRVHLVPQADHSFSFSPDSRNIAYDIPDMRGSDIYVVPARGGSPERITDDHESLSPVWGKPGIAFIRFDAHRSHGEIWLSDGTKNHARQLTHAGTNDVEPVAFSADGGELLAAYPPSNAGRLYAVDLATGAEHPITPWLGDLNAQAISAGGKTVLAVVGCGVGPMYGDVETIPFSGGKPRVIAQGPCFASWNAR